MALAVVVAVAAPVGLLSASQASATAGAVGSLDTATVNGFAPLNDGSPTYLEGVYVAGWAYNAHTQPMQAVALYVTFLNGVHEWSVNQIFAGLYRPDVLKAHAASTAYVGFAGNFTLAIPSIANPIYSICAMTHDQGQYGGWVQLPNCKVVYRPA